MEIFRSLYSNKKVKILIDELKGLQDVLGELQDLEVYIEILQNYLAEKYPREATNQKSENIIEQLIHRMSDRKLKVKDKFQAKFDSFASKKNRKLFKTLFEFIDN